MKLRNKELITWSSAAPGGDAVLKTPTAEQLNTYEASQHRAHAWSSAALGGDEVSKTPTAKQLNT